MTQKDPCNLTLACLSRLTDPRVLSSCSNSPSARSTQSSMNFHDFTGAVSSFWNLPSPVLYQMNLSLWSKAWESSPAQSLPAPLPLSHILLPWQYTAWQVFLCTQPPPPTPGLSSSCSRIAVTVFYLCIARAWHIKKVQRLIDGMRKWKSEIKGINEKINAPVVWQLGKWRNFSKELSFHLVKVDNYSEERPEAMIIYW